MVDRTIEEVLAAAKASSTRTGSLIEVFKAKKAELVEALGNAMTPEVHAAINEVFDIETADAAAIDGALNTNVPPPEPTPTP